MSYRFVAAALVLTLAACGGETHSRSEDSERGGPDSGATVTNDAGSDADPSTNSATGDSGSTDDATTSLEDAGETPDSGQPPEGSVPIFVATGDLGRTTISCDDGRTWIANRSYDLEQSLFVCGNTTTVECYDSGCEFLNGDTCETQGSNCDCNHHPGAPQGVAWGDGWFMATWGWGPPGSVQRSRNGIEWEPVTEETRYGGIAFGDGAFVAGARNPGVTYDGGETWGEPVQADLRSPDGSAVHNVRKFGFADGVFVIAASSGSNRSVMVSRDRGESWIAPDSLDARCADGTRAIAGGDETIVITHRDGLACVSDDQGATFEAVVTDHDFGSSLHFIDGAFVTFGGGAMLTSTDGRSWSATETTGAANLGPVAYNPETGVFAAFNGGWKRWYDQQQAFWSPDGVEWNELGDEDFVRSHKIDYITFGWAPAATCE